MIVCAAPPLFTCRLPGPWQDSQPIFFAFSPFACNRACVAVRKLRVISLWHVSQLSEPTNSAPGMLGGARMVWFVVLQESRITASAAIPPTPHKIFSRLPWVHRDSLECHTNTECCENLLAPTTHFYGKYHSLFLCGLSVQDLAFAL